MDQAIAVDLEQLARALNLPAQGVRRAVELLDEGNTVPFITRYRKDQTGGLDDQQIRQVQDELARLRLLAERKQTILKTIEGQGRLTAELAEQIRDAPSVKVLEDLYLPYRPKKRSLATQARERGLEPLAIEVLSADAAALDLRRRAADFLDEQKQLATVDDCLVGVGHLLVEHYGEQAVLRARLRRLLWRTGRLVSRKLEMAEAESRVAEATQDMVPPAPCVSEPVPSLDAQATVCDQPPSTSETPGLATPGGLSATDSPGGEALPGDTRPPESPGGDAADPSAAPEEAPASGRHPPAGPLNVADPLAHGVAAAAIGHKTRAQLRRDQKRALQQRKREKLQQAFTDYFRYQEPLPRIPHHRVLAINRGERAHVLRVRIEADAEQLRQEAEQLLIRHDHPHVELLRRHLGESLTRSVLPALEREIRRELADRAESHAVDVFARNLRKLLLQPPLHGHRVLAIDPGLRSGCKLAALNEFGSVLGHAVIYVIGPEARRQAGRAALVAMIKEHGISVIAVGNGTGCRETELLVSDVLADELKEDEVSYVIANEAGASVYSTSDIGREELPEFDPTLRSSVSIGRRILDPLSELVKINPANIGVGLYQHDIKARPLQTSLDGVVESCVNYVGVDLNMASPALLGYVSGLNQLTARRIYEHRQKHGPFRSRAQLKDIPGIGEATFVQAAGFLKIKGGDNPLDATWIHPESYNVAQRVLERLTSCGPEQTAEAPPSTAGCAELNGSAGTRSDAPPAESAAEPSVPIAEAVPQPAPPALPDGLAQRAAHLDVDGLAAELGVGPLLVGDLLGALVRPGRDPREDLPPPVFRRGVLKLEDLEPGMQLTGTVLNVVDFGAFVDLGLSDSGLVHVSRLANHYVTDPHDVVSVGDVLKVWVVGVDKQRRRVSLTAIEPGTETPREPARARPAGDSRRPRPRAAAAPVAATGQAAGQAPSQGRRTRRDTPRRDAPRRERPPATPRPPARPATPITDAMAEGREPMRTFADLKQFFERKEPAPHDEPDQTGG